MLDPTKTLATLAAIPGFGDLNPEELARLIERGELATWRDGEAILLKGSPSDSMHVLARGRARVSIGREGAEPRSIQLETGSVFGEIGMLSGNPRSADVFALGPATTLVLRRQDVEPLLWDHPPLARFLTSLVRRRLKRSGDLTKVGKYRILRHIGHGASSDVFEAVHEGLGRLVALKMLSHTHAYDRPLRDRFVDEGRVIASLEHPNIVRVYDSEAAFATHFIVMERLEGTDLRDLLSQRGRLQPSDAADVLGQTASALAFAHGRGIAHGDVKPANCRVAENGRIKLMDFGLATRVEPGAQTPRDQLIVGTPRYMAPELIRGAPADPASDVYALGVMAFEVLAGRPPFVGEPRAVLREHLERTPPDLASAVPGVPDQLARFVRGALAKDPRRRPGIESAATMYEVGRPHAPSRRKELQRTTVHLDHAPGD
ncbi:MAG: protein kinase, partial [Deltaproteobacteria bacterium]|nr:protein kinase [Deltaproteobacteria bacterium]